MPKTRSEILKEAILRYDDGGVAEAIDNHIGNPDHDSRLFQRTIEDFAAYLDQALAEADA